MRKSNDEKTFFRFKAHPGDLLRNTNNVELPNPNENLEDFLVWFLRSYQSDSRVAYINDLSKLLEGEYFDEEDYTYLISCIGNKTDKELSMEIELIENELKSDAYKNFYHLIRTEQIEILKFDKNE
jgi:hypothetical protein